jgi:hypothetical protein
LIVAPGENHSTSPHGSPRDSGDEDSGEIFTVAMQLPTEALGRAARAAPPVVPIFPGPWRDGDLLVVQHEAPLPPRCAICNAPAHPEPVRMRFASNRGSGILGAVISAGIDAATGQHYVGPVRVDMPLCSGHRARRKRLWLVILAVIGVFGIAAVAVDTFRRTNDGLAFALTIPIFLALLVAAPLLIGQVQLWFKPKKFFGPWVWLQNSWRSYLDTLPPLDPSVLAQWQRRNRRR